MSEIVQNFGDFRRLIERIKHRTWAFIPYDQGDGRVGLVMRWEAPDSDAVYMGKSEQDAPRAFPQSVRMFQLGVNTAQQIIEMIRLYVREGVTHEVDEFFMIDGERPFHPHRSKLSLETILYKSIAYEDHREPVPPYIPQRVPQALVDSMKDMANV